MSTRRPVWRLILSGIVIYTGAVLEYGDEYGRSGATEAGGDGGECCRVVCFLLDPPLSLAHPACVLLSSSCLGPCQTGSLVAPPKLTIKLTELSNVAQAAYAQACIHELHVPDYRDEAVRCLCNKLHLTIGCMRTDQLQGWWWCGPYLPAAALSCYAGEGDCSGGVKGDSAEDGGHGGRAGHRHDVVLNGGEEEEGFVRLCVEIDVTIYLQFLCDM